MEISQVVQNIEKLISLSNCKCLRKMRGMSENSACILVFIIMKPSSFPSQSFHVFFKIGRDSNEKF